MAVSRCAWRCTFSVALAAVALGASGCGPSLVATPDASDWESSPGDPQDDGPPLPRWPGWRGVNGDGIARGGRPPVHFGPEQAVRWKAAVPGQGHSSPVVWDKYVLLTSAIGSEPGELTVLCFDRADGHLLWQTSVGKALGRKHDKNSYASASVATDGQRIYAFFGANGLFCFDFQGQQLWHADLGPIDHQWGFASSPVLYGDTVIEVCDGEQDAYIAAFDKTTGKQRWRTARPSQGCWSTPMLVPVEGGRTEMVVNGTTHEPSGDGLVLSYDPADGRELWRVRGTMTFVTPTSLVARGLVFSLSGRNGPILAIKPGGTGDVTESHVVWHTSRGGPYIPSGVVYRNRLYVVGDAGTLCCYNPGSGKVLWDHRLRGIYTASLVAADGRIYATSESGTVNVFAAGDTFQSLAKNELDAKCLATPAAVEDELLVRTDSELYCFADQASEHRTTSSPESVTQPKAPAGLGDNGSENRSKGAAEAGSTEGSRGSETQSPPDSWPLFRGDALATGVATSKLPEKLDRLWTFSVEHGGFESSAAIVDGMVYVGSTDGKLYKLKLADGSKQWEFPTKFGFTASPAVRDGRVYIGDSDGQFYCIDAATGEKRWDFMTEGEIDSSANFYRDEVIVGSQDTMLYCLKADSGELVWKYESADQIRCFPTVVGDRTFVAGCDGRLHIIDLATGKEVDGVELGGPTMCSPAVLGDTIFVGTESSTFFAIDWKQAKVVWQYENKHPAAFRSSAAVTPEAIIVGSRDKQVHALSPKTGDALWDFQTKSRVDSSPVVVGGRLFVGSGDGRLYAIDRKTGQELWRFELGGNISASPAVADGRLVIGSDRGDLACFGLKSAE